MNKKITLVITVCILLGNIGLISASKSLILDQSNESGSEQTLTSLSTTWIAQSFQPTITDLTKVDLYLSRDQDATNGNIKVSIKSSLTGSDLASKTIGITTINYPYTNGNWYSFIFSSSITITPGSTYYIVLCLTQNQPSNNNLYWWHSSDNSYQHGSVYYSVNSGSTWNDDPDPNKDTLFKTYGNNQAPNTPQQPAGPTTGVTGVSYTFNTYTTDPEGHQVYYKFDWGDGVISSWIGPAVSGQIVFGSHTWTAMGVYFIKAKAKDIYGDESGWSTSHSIVISAGSNQAPNTPSTPSGPTTRTIGQSGTYSTSAIDPDGDQVQYRFDWGDGTTSDWTELVASGTSASKSYSWSLSGTYVVTSQAKDEYGATSGWSSGLTVIVTASQNNAPNTPSKPTGPETIYIYTNGLYITSAIDPDGDQVQYRFDWGDGEISPWSSLVPSGQSSGRGHSWSNTGEFIVKAQAKDEYGAASSWSEGLVVTVESENLPPTEPDKPIGPTIRLVNQIGTYSTRSIDFESDSVQFQYNWGDGTTSQWSEYVSSGESISMSYHWQSSGTYTVKCRARDVHGGTSGWSKELQVFVVLYQNDPTENCGIVVAADSYDETRFFPMPFITKGFHFLSYAYIGETLIDYCGMIEENMAGMSPFGNDIWTPPPEENRPTKSNLQYYITEWLANKSTVNNDIIIYLIGPCKTNGNFRINMEEDLSPTELNTWLQQIEYRTLILVIDGSYSGGFCGELSGQNRIIITSTDTDRPAYYFKIFNLLSSKAMLFTQAFCDILRAGGSYGKAWENADREVYLFCEKYDLLGALPPSQQQIPQIEDNGDNVPHGYYTPDTLPVGGDGNIALITFPGNLYFGNVFINTELTTTNINIQTQSTLPQSQSSSTFLLPENSVIYEIMQNYYK